MGLSVCEILFLLLKCWVNSFYTTWRTLFHSAFQFSKKKAEFTCNCIALLAMLNAKHFDPNYLYHTKENIWVNCELFIFDKLKMHKVKNWLTLFESNYSKSFDWLFRKMLQWQYSKEWFLKARMGISDGLWKPLNNKIIKTIECWNNFAGSSLLSFWRRCFLQ